jgi:hypothetical protein
MGEWGIEKKMLAVCSYTKLLSTTLDMHHCSYSHPFNHRCVNDAGNNGT